MPSRSRILAIVVRLVGAMFVALSATSIGAGATGWRLWGWFIVLSVGLVASVALDVFERDAGPPPPIVDLSQIQSAIMDVVYAIDAHTQATKKLHTRHKRRKPKDRPSRPWRADPELVRRGVPVTSLPPPAPVDPERRAIVVAGLRDLGVKGVERAADELLVAAPLSMSAEDLLRQYITRGRTTRTSAT